ncbi:uncharacterized protein LOC126314422 [Schistocerca gregaria]|uniref:uncharacterized protein LOC126314422 n=1 Tax=Schistocerca gregaria TaxID=7010 RepID=UPI00211EF9DF|nr:uncharacterized protein LOC126314422 [Schistocerca gregaria]
MEDEAVVSQPIVLDNGSGTIKAGFAGENSPKVCFPSYVGVPKHIGVMAGCIQNDERVIGNRAQSLRGLLALNYPIEHGIVKNWTDMEKIWANVYQELQINSEDHPMLLTEPPLNPISNRETASEILFETFNVPALFISLHSVLSLYANGMMTGVVLDCGDGVSYSVPIYEGFAIQSSIQRVDLAGRDITSQLQLLLRKSGYSLFTTSAEFDIVKDIKEKHCYVAYDPTKEEEAFLELNRHINPDVLKLRASTPSSIDYSKNSLSVHYQLPDHQILELKSELFRAPEILFQPHLLGLETPGLHHLLYHSVSKCDIDLRKGLYSSIVLAGGSTLLSGFADRLLKETHAISPKNMKIRIYAPEQRQFTTWIGGSILAALSSFKDLWVSSQEYSEEGPYILQKKFFL